MTPGAVLQPGYFDPARVRVPQSVSITFNTNTPQGDAPGPIFINFGLYNESKRRSRSPVRTAVAPRPVSRPDDDLTSVPMFARGRFVPVGVPTPLGAPFPGTNGLAPPFVLATPAIAAPTAEAPVAEAPAEIVPPGAAPGADTPTPSGEFVEVEVAEGLATGAPVEAPAADVHHGSM